jgi:hypothetical protein
MRAKQPCLSPPGRCFDNTHRLNEDAADTVGALGRLCPSASRKGVLIGPFHAAGVSENGWTSLLRWEFERTRGRKNNSRFLCVLLPDLSHFITEPSSLRGQVVHFTGIVFKIVKLPVTGAEGFGKPEQLEISLPHGTTPKQFPVYSRIVLVNDFLLSTQHGQEGSATKTLDLPPHVRLARMWNVGCIQDRSGDVHHVGKRITPCPLLG